MAATSTTSNYTNQIKTNYPYRGQNNDSQGFRDNFSAIKNAITSADADIQLLKGSLITNTTTSNFYDHKILKAVFQDCADQIYSAPDTSGSIQVDYTQGNYQDFQLNGDVTFTFSGFPTSGYGSVIISCTPTGTVTIAFADNLNAVGVGTSYSEDIVGTTFWQIWSADSGNTIYFTKLGNNTNVTAVATATNINAFNSLTIGLNKYTTGNTASNFITTVAAGGQYGTLALLPTRITGSVKSTSTSTVDSSTLRLVDNTGIKQGATVRFPTTSTLFTVAYISGPDVVVTPAADNFRDFPPDINSNVSVTFTNPTFSAQPIISTIAASEPTTLFGGLTDTVGQIHASSTTLYVSHKNYDGGLTQNWFKVSADSVARQLVAGTSATTVDISNSSTVLATTEFTQNLVSSAIYGGIEGALPAGVILLWYGAIANIPTGWQLCDGTNGAPDLRGKFVIGASVDNAQSTATTTITGSQTITGGSANNTLVNHTHIAGSVVSDLGHHHNSQYDGRTPGSIDYTGAGSEIGGMGTGYTYPTTDSPTGITVSTTILSAGDNDGTNANLPPYYALAYIIKMV